MRMHDYGATIMSSERCGLIIGSSFQNNITKHMPSEKRSKTSDRSKTIIIAYKAFLNSSLSFIILNIEFFRILHLSYKI